MDRNVRVLYNFRPPPRMVEAFVAQNPDSLRPTRPAQIGIGFSRPTNIRRSCCGVAPWGPFSL